MKDEMKPRNLLHYQPIRRRSLLRGAAIGVAGAASASLLGLRPSTSRADTPKRGGNLRVAILGGSSADTLDAHSEV